MSSPSVHGKGAVEAQIWLPRWKRPSTATLSEFLVDYDNPIDDENHDFSANNVREFRLCLKIAGPDIDGEA